MTRLRRQLLVLSAPVVLVLVLIVGRAVWNGISDAAALQQFSDGVTAAREDRLTDAAASLTAALNGTEPEESCSLRVNLEFVYETLGDRAAFRTPRAIEHYRDARRLVDEAPPGCFADNSDPDADRQVLREGAAARLDDKIAAVSALPPPPPPAPPPPAAAPPPATGGAPVTDVERERLLYPEEGDPLDRLRDILRDAVVR